MVFFFAHTAIARRQVTRVACLHSDARAARLFHSPSPTPCLNVSLELVHTTPEGHYASRGGYKHLQGQSYSSVPRGKRGFWVQHLRAKSTLHYCCHLGRQHYQAHTLPPLLQDVGTGMTRHAAPFTRSTRCAAWRTRSCAGSGHKTAATNAERAGRVAGQAPRRASLNLYLAALTPRYRQHHLSGAPSHTCLAAIPAPVACHRHATALFH